MSRSPRISDAEWHVMAVLWDQHPIGAAEVTATLEPEHGWSEATVKTMLSRLVKKGAATFTKDGKRYLYRPSVDRESCVRHQAKELADRAFAGEASPMLTWFVEETPLSSAEIDALQALLDAKKLQGKGRGRRAGSMGSNKGKSKGGRS